jgi:hypothetical protein
MGSHWWHAKKMEKAKHCICHMRHCLILQQAHNLVHATSPHPLTYLLCPLVVIASMQAQARDPVAAKNLWEASERMVGLKK